jgi:hypothetical protein
VVITTSDAGVYTLGSNFTLISTGGTVGNDAITPEVLCFFSVANRSTTGLLDLANTIDGKTLRQAIRIIAAMVAGLVTGARTGTETFKGLDKTTTRAVITVDSQGNRGDASYP